MISNSQWNFPATTVRPDGKPRQVGIEIEMQGIPVEVLVLLVQAALGGSVRELSRSEYELDVPEQGVYRIEVDYALLKEMAREESDRDIDNSVPKTLVIDALDAVSTLLVPCEIVSPPLAMDTIAEPMDAIVHAVRDAGANGTRKSVMYAFGVHLNVEPTNMEASTLLSYIQAFVCLFDWIVYAGKVDLSRRVTPYINPFPADYQALILAPDYQPDMGALIADYLRHNSTRNRALDMLPLFSMIDEKTVMDTVKDDRVNARPAFHYRLANSCVDEAGWSIAEPWSRWLKIEQLAADRDALKTLGAEFRTDSERVLHSVDSQWRERVQLWAEKS